MVDIRPSEGGEEFPFPRTLMRIRLNLILRSQASGPGNALPVLGIPPVPQRLAGKKFLTVEQRDALCESGGVDVPRRLPAKPVALEGGRERRQARGVLAGMDGQFLHALCWR